jgi:hypothetical protein
MQRSQNYVGLIEHWVIAACQVLRFAARRKLRPNVSQPFVERCHQAIMRASDALAAEVAECDDLVDERSFLDQAFLPYRRTLLLGYLAARINSRFIQGFEVRADSANLLTLAKREAPFGVWGEGAWNYWLNLALALSHSPEGALFGEGLIGNWLDVACPATKPYLKDPYAEVGDALSLTKAFLERNGADQREDRISYSAENAVAFLVRRMRRQAVAARWTRFSRFRVAHVKPDRAIDELAWAIEDGRVIVEELPLTGSWAELQTRASRNRSRLFRQSQLWLLPYFLCTFPHRVTPALSGELYARACRT